MVTVIPADDSWQRALQQAGADVGAGYTDRADDMALQKAIRELPADATPRQRLDAILNTRTYSPESKQRLFKNYLGAEEFDEMRNKARQQEAISQEKNRIAGDKKKKATDEEALRQSLIASGMPDYEADLYIRSPPGVQGRIMAAHNEAVARNLRSPNAPKRTETGLAGADEQKAVEAPVYEAMELEQEALKPVEQALAQAEQPKQEKEWPDLVPPPETTPAEREKWRSANQKENNKLLHTVKEKNTAHTNAMIRFNRQKALNDSGKLPSGLGRLAINPETGEPYGVASLLGVVNKETQDFVKTMNDFLIDAKAYFGGRVTNFDVAAFKSRLPSLMNTEDGRRLIIEQMRMMEELQVLHDGELEKGLKHYGRNASYADIQNVVDQKVGTKEQSIINKINSLDQASEYMDRMLKAPATFKDTVLMQNEKTGAFKAVPKIKVNDAKARGYMTW